MITLRDVQQWIDSMPVEFLDWEVTTSQVILKENVPDGIHTLEDPNSIWDFVETRYDVPMNMISFDVKDMRVIFGSEIDNKHIKI